jgi:hypothetical protein
MWTLYDCKGIREIVYWKKAAARGVARNITEAGYEDREI